MKMYVIAKKGNCFMKWRKSLGNQMKTAPLVTLGIIALTKVCKVVWSGTKKLAPAANKVILSLSYNYGLQL